MRKEATLMPAIFILPRLLLLTELFFLLPLRDILWVKRLSSLVQATGSETAGLSSHVLVICRARLLHSLTFHSARPVEACSAELT